jgi:CRISPR/Cas system-associated exonuclease Cas4 (RecB family)
MTEELTEELKEQIFQILDETRNLIEDECVVVARDNLQQLIQLLTD